MFCRMCGEFAEAFAGFVVDPERDWHRAVLGATAGAPLVVDDARHLDASAVAATLYEVGTYEHQVHHVALKRAAAALVA